MVVPRVGWNSRPKRAGLSGTSIASINLSPLTGEKAGSAGTFRSTPVWFRGVVGVGVAAAGVGVRVRVGVAGVESWVAGVGDGDAWRDPPMIALQKLVGALGVVWGDGLALGTGVSGWGDISKNNSN